MKVRSIHVDIMVKNAILKSAGWLLVIYDGGNPGRIQTRNPPDLHPSP